MGGCCGSERSIHMNRDKESATITDLKKYFTLGGCCGSERSIHMNRDRESATITDLKKYFTLGGCCGPEICYCSLSLPQQPPIVKYFLKSCYCSFFTQAHTNIHTHTQTQTQTITHTHTITHSHNLNFKRLNIYEWFHENVQNSITLMKNLKIFNFKF